MITVHHNKFRITAEALEASLPPGMMGKEESAGTQNAARALRILERIVRETSAQNALYNRYALLQSFPRMTGDADVGAESTIDVPDFVRQYAVALCPDWYAEYLQQLSSDEGEVLLKHYLHAHEMWGRPEAVGALVRTMLESCVHSPLAVVVEELQGQECAIPQGQYSLLGRKESFSYLGKNLVLGRKVISRPEQYRVLIGPVTAEVMDTLQRAGWADGSQPSKKLHRLTELAEPFYLRAKIQFLLETSESGFVLGRTRVGNNTLGFGGSAIDRRLNLLGVREDTVV